MKLKKSIRKKINIAIIVVVVIAVLGIMYLGYKRFFTKTPVAVKPKVVDTIENYGYELEEGQTALYKKLYDELVLELKKSNLKVETGIFGADMKVSLTNDGPVTIMLEK